MPRTVLLVDDAAFVRSMLREILERSGAYRIVAEASDGVAALTLAPELHPDLIISDLIMPGLDGVELARAIAGGEPPCRIVLAASADQEGGVLNGLEAGAADFIMKPFASEDLLRTLALPPPLPAADEAAPLHSLYVRLSIDPEAPLPRARRRALFGHLKLLDPAAVHLEEEAPLLAPSLILEALLATRLEEESVRGWLGRLWGVAEVEIRSAPSVEDEPERFALPGAPRLAGSLRIKAHLLDRLLDHLDQMAADRQEIARHCLAAAGGEAPLPVEATLRRFERGIARMRSEILAARLVSFDRIASRLGRAVQESGRRAGRSASLKLLGGETRLDLAVLEEIAALMEWWLPRVVLSEVGRADILRQLGRSEAQELYLAVSRSGARLVLQLHLPASPESSEEGDLDAVLLERLARMGGTASAVAGETERKIEILLPAGVSLVRSYLCQAGRQLFAIPVASVERAVDLPASGIRVSEGRTFWQEDGGERVPLVRFPRIPWTLADGPARSGFPGLVYRVGPQRYALAMDALLGETDVVVRPLKDSGNGGQMAGMALMADGGIAMVPDLPSLARVR
ncbi:MAG TPA: response regulator [Candidatus Polarisedimenticolia bacterium]|nr:response regulator [Candidatus Polarisedimenticolia bacterium]